jgi:spermidine/putrescine transport system permease protein
LLPLYVWVFFFVIAPLVIIAFYGLTVETDKGLVLSFENFKRFADITYINVFMRSLKIALLSTAICLVLGYPVAYILSTRALRQKSFLLLLFLLPMWMNFLLRTYSWLTLLENSGLINRLIESLGLPKAQLLYNEDAVVLGTVANFLPFMIMPIYITLVKLDSSQLEAAADLGANPFNRFVKITLPFSVNGILSGISMVFVPSVTTFVISQLMGGGKFPLIGDIIERQFRVVDDWHFGATISLVIMVVVLLFMYTINKGDVENQSGEGYWI